MENNQNNYEPELVTVEDEEGNIHQFEILDAIETDDGKFLALIPYEDAADDEEIELIPVQVIEQDEGTTLAPIEDEELMDDIASIFEERLSELFEEE